MSKRRLLIAILIFVLYAIAAWVGALFLAPASLFFLVVFILIALGLTVLVVYLLMSRMTAGARAPEPAKAEGAPAAAAPAAASAQDPELKIFTSLIGEANTRLAQSPKLASRRVSTTVTGLPLLLLAGDAGAGKTATFLNAGLDPELLAGQVFRDSDVLPTRIANLWYASDVVFVEPSGALFSGDAGRWRGLLQRMRAKSAAGFIRRIFGGRTDAQLRGVIFFCDLNPFLGIPDAGRLGSLARRCQERLRQVGESFGINFPVYVVFTHGDAVPFFGEYFGHLVENEDQQILGCTLPAVAPNARPASEVYSEAETARLADAFNTLSFSLAEKRMAMLPRENNAAAKPPIYEFPREIRRVRDSVVQFLVDAFRPNPLQPGPILRGFYFTGTRKVTVSALASAPATDARARVSAGEATSLFNLADYQKKMGLVEEASTSPVETTVMRWSFVSDLFHRVILHDPLSSAVAFANRRQDLYRRILWGGATALGVVLCLLFIRSWWGNAGLLDAVQDAAHTPYTYQANVAEPSLDNLKSMEALREQLETLLTYQRERPPLRLRWFLYSGGRVLPSLYDLYFQRFRQVFYDNFQGNIATTLIGLPSSPEASHSYNAVYDRVKAYRMITQCKCSPEPAFLAPVLNEVWETGKNLDADRQALALKQIVFYADELKYKNPYRIDEKSDVVERGRMYLSAFGGVERIYRGIVEEANKSPRRPARLGEIAPNFQDVLSTPGEVQAAFTREGWMFAAGAIKDPSRLAMGEPCVVGASSIGSQLLQGPEIQAQLQNMYISDYIRRWKDFVGSTSVLPYRDVKDASHKLSILANNRSPLLAAVFLVSDNTNFPPRPNTAPATSALSSAITRMLPSSANQAANLAKSAMPTVAPPQTTDDITKVFQPSREVVAPGSRDRLIDDPNRKYMDSLATLQGDLDKLSNDNPSNPDMNLNQQAAQAVDAGLDSVRQISQKFNIASQGVDTELQKFLESPFRDAQRFIITDPTKAGREKANGALRQFCARLAATERKFPFNPSSDTDASVDEVTSIFAPQSGAFAAFTQQVAKLAVKQGRLWVANPESQDVHPSEDFLRFLNRLQQVQDALFANGSPTMKTSYTLRPLPGQNVQAITLDIDGQKITASGQAQSKQFSWPGSGQVVVTVKAGGNIPFGSYSGPWGVWRWMYDADARAPGSKTAQWSMLRQGHGQPQAPTDADGKPIVLKIELSELPEGIDIFDRGFFAIRCPGRAAQ